VLRGIQLLHQTFILLSFTTLILSVQYSPALQISLVYIWHLPNAALQFHVSSLMCHEKPVFGCQMPRKVFSFNLLSQKAELLIFDTMPQSFFSSVCGTLCTCQSRGLADADSVRIRKVLLDPSSRTE
jgi:hypothetical protein